jgi:hypothetical protein
VQTQLWVLSTMMQAESPVLAASRPVLSEWGLQIDLSVINSSDYVLVPSLLARQPVLTSSSSLLQIDYMPQLYTEYVLGSG